MHTPRLPTLVACGWRPSAAGRTRSSRSRFADSRVLPPVLAPSDEKGRLEMRRGTILAAALMCLGANAVNAQTATPLSSYADADGWIDVQKLTCEQLAGTYQQDADMLSTWYSGWYNGLAKKHMFN